MQQTPDIKRFRRSLDSRLTQWLNCNSTNNKCCNQSLFYIRKQNTLEPTLIVIWINNVHWYMQSIKCL